AEDSESTDGDVMALSFPLSRAAFIDDLPIVEVAFTPAPSQERSKKGGGRTIYADLAPTLWMARVATPPMPHADALRYLALINSLGGALRTFLLYDKRMAFPASDPSGSIFGAASPKVGVITDRFTAAFVDFPNNYVIPAGTWVQVIFDTSRYYLGQFVEGAAAHGAGAVAATSLAPALPDGVLAGDAVTVIEAAGKFRILPGSASVAMSNTIHSSIAFEAEQTYEA